MTDSEIFRDKKYQNDKIFNAIQSRHLTLNDDDIKRNNQNLQKIVSEGLIPLMKKADPLFQDMFQNIKYAGSFYKGTKVGKPDEYDLDLVMKLPLNYKTLLIDTNHANYGYVKIKLGENSKLPEWENVHSKVLDKWLNEKNYLYQEQFRRWMEKVMTKTYEQLEKNRNDEYELVVENKTYTLKRFKKSGPAFTVYVKLKNEIHGNKFMDIDIVPCLEFDDIPLKGYRTIDTIPSVVKNNFVVVAKPSTDKDGHLLWRLSFYAQERKILLDPEFGKIKNTIRMIKKFRDRHQMKKLASYYIETLCLEEIIKRQKVKTFFRAPNTGLFIYMLHKLREAFDSKNLPYFWHKKHNLLIKMDPMEATNCANRINNILVDLDKNFLKDNLLLARITLSAIEASRLSKIEDEPRRSSTTSSIDSVDSANVENRVDTICNELSALANLESIPKECLEKIRKACTNFLKSKI